MKCLACDKILTDKEAVRKSLITQEYLDLCDGCLKDSDVLTNELFSDIEEDEDVVD